MDDQPLSRRPVEWGDPFPAPAKINLFLHVVGRRADGYHLLQTAFRLVDLCDVLRFQPRDDAGVTRLNLLPGVDPESDLTVRAARLLQKEAGVKRGVAIELDKRIPLGGGLGGGSSDAATVLVALNHLWGVGFSRPRLQALALQLGADVPFFVFGANAFAEGVGERLAPIELPPSWYVIATPGVSVPTAEIFRAPHLTRSTKAIKIADFSAGWGHNDLEPVACERYPAVAQALSWLKQFGDARMSGSGASVFAPVASEQAARAACSQTPPGLQTWVARGLDVHPLRHLAE